MELKDLMKKPWEIKPWEYNFEWECKALQRFETFERYFRYKASAQDLDIYSRTYCEAEDFIEQCQKKYKGADCDSCDPILEIYSALWSDCKWRGETMNSVQTPMAELVHFCFGEDKKAKFNGKQYNSRKYLIQCFCGENCKNFKEELDNTKGLHDYVEAYHTLGNFVLVPEGFNRDRGPYGCLKVKLDDNSESSLQDFWDLSLEYLRTKDYKEDFKHDMFKKYINYFFLWDYVKVKENDYEINPIGMEKLTDDRKLPDFFTEAAKRILRRGKFMTAMLIIQNESNDIYSDIREELQDQALNGMDGAAKHILDKFANKLNDNKFDKAKDILNNL